MIDFRELVTKLPAPQQAELVALRETLEADPTLTPLQRLLRLAQALALLNPDAAEILGETMAYYARLQKEPDAGLMLTAYRNPLTHCIELRIGDVRAGYVEQRPDAIYTEVHVPLRRPAAE